MSELCPKCKGGQSGEKSYKEYDNDGIKVGICFRASCGYKSFEEGSYDDKRQALDARRKRASATPEHEVVRDPNAMPLSDGALLRLSRRYKLKPDTIVSAGVGLCYEGKYYTIPIVELVKKTSVVNGYGMLIPNPLVRGYVERAVDGSVYPKALTKLPEALLKAPCTTLANTRSSFRTLWVVEDAWSCMAVQEQGYPCITLLGTLVRSGVRDTLLRWLSEGLKVRLALDADATRQAINLTRLFRGSGKAFQVRRLETDIKDMEVEERIELLKS